jgi:hypothetical protein
MRSFLTYGAISLVGIAALYACGDDSGDGSSSVGGAAGQGGTAGAGTGGTAGTGMGGTGGGGAAGTAGSGNTPVVIPASNCTGCVQLSVVVPATPQNATTGSQAGYIFSAPATAAPFDLSNVTTITWHVQALTPGAAFFVQPFLQNAPPEDMTYFGSYPAQVFLTPTPFAAGTFVDVVMNVAAIPGGGGGADAGADGGADAGDAGAGPLTAFDKSKTRTVGLNVGAGPTAPANSVVSVEISEVTVVGPSNFTTKTFDTGVDTLGLNMYMVPPGTLAPAFH